MSSERTCRAASPDHRRVFTPRLVPIAASALAVTAAVAGATASSAAAAQATPGPLARAAHTLSVRDQGRLHLVRSSGSLLIDEGRASGTLPGSVYVRFVYDGSPTVTAQLTIAGPGWSLRARGSGRLSSPTSPAPSFRGSLAIVGGSGRYARARGSGELFGVFYRRSYGLTVQAIGKLTY